MKDIVNEFAEKLRKCGYRVWICLDIVVVKALGNKCIHTYNCNGNYALIQLRTYMVSYSYLRT